MKIVLFMVKCMKAAFDCAWDADKTQNKEIVWDKFQRDFDVGAAYEEI